MKVAVTEEFQFPPEIVFAAITDIPHHVDWVEGPLELTSLSDGPAQLGTKWTQDTLRVGKRLITLNTCNLYEKNKKFGWHTEKPYPAQVTILLEPGQEITKLTWKVESEAVGIVKMVEPLLTRQTSHMIQHSMNRLKDFIQQPIHSERKRQTKPNGFVALKRKLSMWFEAIQTRVGWRS